MKYKKGDKIRIRVWDDVVKEVEVLYSYRLPDFIDDFVKVRFPDGYEMSYTPQQLEQREKDAAWLAPLCEYTEKDTPCRLPATAKIFIHEGDGGYYGRFCETHASLIRSDEYAEKQLSQI